MGKAAKIKERPKRRTLQSKAVGLPESHTAVKLSNRKLKKILWFQGPQRLPDGARFEVTWDGVAGAWSGSLMVAGQTFSGSAAAVFCLLSALDKRFRMWEMVQPRGK